MSTVWVSPRRALAVVITAAAVAIGSIASMSTASAAPARARTITPKALALHDEMRALWEAHGTWTERAIVDFVGGLPDTPLVIGRLLANQTDVGNALKPYYGAKAGNELTVRLRTRSDRGLGRLELSDPIEAAARLRTLPAETLTITLRTMGGECGATLDFH